MIKGPYCRSDNANLQRFCGECGTRLELAEDIQVSQTKTLEASQKELTTGSTFAGRYQIVEELGRGGMGRVYRALDKQIGEEVALKLIRPDTASEKGVLERFANELKIACKIVHRNVGQIYHLSGFVLDLEATLGTEICRQGAITQLGILLAALCD